MVGWEPSYIDRAESFAMDAENCRENHLMCDDCMAVCLECNLDADAGGDICKFCSGESIERYDEIGLDAESFEAECWDCGTTLDECVGCKRDRRRKADYMYCPECEDEGFDSDLGWFCCGECWDENTVTSTKLRAESFEAPYTGAGSLMGISGDTDLSSFTPDELTKSSAIHGDFDTASLDYSGHQNIEVRAEEDHLECSRCGDSSPVYFGILSLCKSCQKLVDSYPAYLRAELKRVSQALDELIYDLQTCDDCGGHREELDCTNVCNCGFLEEDQPKITQQYKSEEGDNEDWDDSDYYDPQAVWESIWENWHDEWMIGEANEDVVNQIAEAVVKNDPAGNLVIVDNYGWYLKLSNEQREDIITKPYLNDIIEDELGRIAESWDDQFMSESFAANAKWHEQSLSEQKANWLAWLAARKS